jgi:hypothetical protein
MSARYEDNDCYASQLSHELHGLEEKWLLVACKLWKHYCDTRNYTLRIKSIDQAKGQLPDGLDEIAMRGLNRIVILAGANGSGKTRLLNRVFRGATSGNGTVDRRRGLVCDSIPKKVTPVRFVAKNLDLSNPSEMSAATIVAQANVAENPGTDNLAPAALPYIQRIQNHWWNATHQGNKEPQSVRNEKVQKYQALRELIRTVLGVELERDDDGNVTLFGKPVFHANRACPQFRVIRAIAA